MFDAFAYDDLMRLSYQHCTSIDYIHIVWRAERFLLTIPCCYRRRLISLYSMDYWRHRYLFCCCAREKHRVRKEEKINIVIRFCLEESVFKLIFAINRCMQCTYVCNMPAYGVYIVRIVCINKCEKPIKSQ